MIFVKVYGLGLRFINRVVFVEVIVLIVIFDRISVVEFVCGFVSMSKVLMLIRLLRVVVIGIISSDRLVRLK